jgi:hypothetical protein
METALVDAIIQLMQVATPPTTTTTPTPIFQMKDERIHGMLLMFISISFLFVFISLARGKNFKSLYEHFKCGLFQS